ncbi:MAG TPA: tetratricopeptide repeat protein [Actinocrinis sp.]|nr:tetratricopeptide repeat protein [Actinocrinis sp.]
MTSECNSPSLQFRLLGAVEAYLDGRRVDIGGAQARSVLAVLLLHPGHAIPKHRLIEYAWGTDPPSTAPMLVVSYLSRLRKALAGHGAEGFRLLAARPGFSAQFDPATVDVHKFTGLVQQALREREGHEDEAAAVHLEAALDLWNGSDTALSGLKSSWLRGHAAHLARRRLDAVEALAGIHLDAGRPSQAARLLRDVAPAHPEREAIAVLLIRALTSVGEAAQAAQVSLQAANALIDLGQTPGPALRQAQTDALARRPDRQPAQAGRRHQLPADTRAFCGRAAELGHLLTVAAPAPGEQRGGKVAICAVDGMGGVGKTALAVHIAHHLAASYPDGQLFIDLHGYTRGYTPRTASEALHVFLRALDVPPQQIPEGTEERAALYRSRLVGTRTLIVLDNARSEAQVRPLLPGSSGCAVLITSRRRLKGLDDAHCVSLGPLPPADAIALFRTVAGPGRVPGGSPELGEVADLCGDLPLAIRIAAALLRHRPSWSLNRLAESLRDRRRLAALSDGERELSAIFDLSYDALTAGQQRLFCHLGLMSGPDFDADAVAALIDTDRPTAVSLLEDLDDHHLLGQSTSGRYRFHDLTRIYAQERVESEDAREREEAVERLLDYYLSTADAANRFLARRTARYPIEIARPPRHSPVFASRAQASAWMSAELANLAAAVEFTARRARSAQSVALASVMHGHLYTDGPWSYARVLHSLTAEVARKAGDRFGQATALHSLGRIKRLMGDFHGAIEAHRQSLELYRATGHRLGQANALDGLGRVLYQISDYPAAADVLDQALHLFEEVGDALGEAGALNGLGRVLRQSGKYAPAAEAHQRARNLCRNAGDVIGEATALNDLGRVQYHMGDYAASRDTQEAALSLYRETGHRLGQANALDDIGRVHRETGDYPAAMSAHESALGLYREMGHRLGRANALNGIGRVRHRIGDHAAADDAHREALRLFREVGDRMGETKALTWHAAALAALGRTDEARPRHTEALRLARELAAPLEEAEALEALAEIDRADRHDEIAASALEHALAIRRSIGAPGADRLAQRLAEWNRDAYRES